MIGFGHHKPYGFISRAIPYDLSRKNNKKGVINGQFITKEFKGQERHEKIVIKIKK